MTSGDVTWYCMDCGLAQYDAKAGQNACKHCGSHTFTTSLRAIQWEIALTWNDKVFLKGMKISPE